MRVLLPGFCYTRRLARLAAGDKKPPVTERLIIYVCKQNMVYRYFVIKLFSIEEMRRYFIMGRGRKGIIEQSERKPKGTGAYGETFNYFSGLNRETKKIPVAEHVIDFMKNMNPQQLADFLLLKDDGQVKTSSASGN